MNSLCISQYWFKLKRNLISLTYSEVLHLTIRTKHCSEIDIQDVDPCIFQLNDKFNYRLSSGSSPGGCYV